MDKHTGLVLAAGLAAGAGLYALIQGHMNAQRLPKHKNVYILVVRLKLKAGGLETFKALWAALATHCRLHEPNTLSYEASFSTDDETDVMIFERYVSESDLTTTHHASAAFKEFGRLTREEYPDLIVGKSRSTWRETNVGFM